jgi:hypothetical protein
MGAQKMTAVEVRKADALGSHGDAGEGGSGGGDLEAAAAAIAAAAAAARPIAGGVTVFVVQNPALLLASACALGFDAVEAADFAPASGLLVEYPPEEGEGAGEWELHRMVSHE